MAASRDPSAPHTAGISLTHKRHCRMQHSQESGQLYPPLSLQLILQLQQLDLHLPLPVVLQDFLVGLLVCCCRCWCTLIEARHRGTAEVELVGTYVPTRTRTPRG